MIRLTSGSSFYRMLQTHSFPSLLQFWWFILETRKPTIY